MGALPAGSSGLARIHCKRWSLGFTEVKTKGSATDFWLPASKSEIYLIAAVPTYWEQPQLPSLHLITISRSDAITERFNC